MCLIAIPFFSLVFAIFDVSRYAITAHSLQTLASMAARQVVINCTSWEITNHHPPYCSAAGAAAVGSDPYTSAQKLAIAPYLFESGYAPAINVAVGPNTVTVTASLPGFTMLMPFMTALNGPSKQEIIPF